MLRLVAYVRVSREDERPENQEFAIYKWGAERGHRVVEVVRGAGASGALPPAERPGWQKAVQLLERADGIVVHALDRIARSLWDLASVARELEARGKLLVSVREEWLQDVDPKIRQLIVAVLGWAAEIEREFIRERTREALARLRAMGRRVGRPPKWSETIRRRIIDLVRRGITLRDACRLAGVGYRTALRYLSRDPEYLKARAEARLKG
ncbi:MAG: recombinase family protein [Thermoproteaceae archaeon]|jgi:putative DNA-invertase from lambdoid prophage Rac|nr:recombinase family protein [Thermoproteaceae archaeon]